MLHHTALFVCQILAKATEALAEGDVVNRRIRQHQNWALMPAGTVLSAVYPASYMRGARFNFGLYPGEMNFPRFSGWFGANSSQGKQRRLLGELHTRMLSSGHFSADR
jgi:replication factor C subunit 1